MLSAIKSFLPKDSADLPAFIFVNLAFCSITAYELITVLPTVDENSKFGFTFHFFLGIFFLINIYGNYIKLIMTDSSTKGMILPTLLKEHWRFCYSCECNSPPRSWHCNICNRCMLRRDHHCTFAGVCVGHRNYRYFLILLLYLSICGVYINVLNAEYAYDILGGFNLRTMMAMFLPWAAWLMGMHGPFTFIVAFMSSLTLFGTLLSMGYLGYQLNLIIKGRTSYELSNRCGKQYDVGALNNIKQVFGKSWKICWLLPWIPSHLYTDGTEFSVRGFGEEVKNL